MLYQYIEPLTKFVLKNEDRPKEVCEKFHMLYNAIENKYNNKDHQVDKPMMNLPLLIELYEALVEEGALKSKDDEILVLYSPEMVAFLWYLGYNNITIATGGDGLDVEEPKFHKLVAGGYAKQYVKLNELGDDMKFDVIIGNPPYQMNNSGDNGGTNATAIYNLFINKAKKLSPNYLMMIVPARWYAGGIGLSGFREEMLADKKIKLLVDYPNSSDCFEGVDIKGGICYFIRDINHNGKCKIVNKSGKKVISRATRNLNDYSVFIRHNNTVKILDKINKQTDKNLSDKVYGVNPFDKPTNFKDYKNEPFDNSVKLYLRGGIGYVSRHQIQKNENIISDYKVLLSRASEGAGVFPNNVMGKPIIAEPNSCCTHTYLVIDTFKSKKEAANFSNYLKTKFVRFLISLKKITQDSKSSTFEFVPDLPMTEEWTDEKLYEKYGLDQDEIDIIEGMIKPMV